jgi:SAM-dependent methyltransferase
MPMRAYILDDLVSPTTGGPLRLENVTAIERNGPPVARCTRWCGRNGAPPEMATEADCRECAVTWIENAVLTDGRERFPVTAGIPRFVGERQPGLDADTQGSFGYEWQHFDSMLSDYDVEIQSYFGIVPRETLCDAIVLDAGCGMGRWARHVLKMPIRRLYALDFSGAIDSAARTLTGEDRAHCVQADVCRLPFRPGSMDFSYCLGVLHHLEDPETGMRSLTQVTRGPLLVYLYYSLDNRPRFHRVLLAAATVARVVTSRLPKRAVHVLVLGIATFVYWPLARLARLLERLGLVEAASQVPLGHYRRYSLRFMVGDAFDRFATPIERRYSRAEISAWLARYGRHAQFSERTPYWVCLGTPTK